MGKSISCGRLLLLGRVTMGACRGWDWDRKRKGASELSPGTRERMTVEVGLGWRKNEGLGNGKAVGR